MVKYNFQHNCIKAHPLPTKKLFKLKNLNDSDPTIPNSHEHLEISLSDAQERTSQNFNYLSSSTRHR